MACAGPVLSSYDRLQKFRSESCQIVRYVYFRSLVRAEQDLSPMKTKALALGEIGRGFYDALRGIYTASKERDRSAFFVKLYRQGEPKEIVAFSERFRQEAYRSTTDDYERGFLLAWEMALKTLGELKEKYPEYPLKEEQQTGSHSSDGDEPDYEVKPRKRAKATSSGTAG
jgi:hypothetical protein